MLARSPQRLGAVPDGAVLGRLSGDEFAVLLVGDVDAEAAARALVDRFEQPFRLEGRELRVTTSVGVARADREDLRANALLRASDTAMYVAKQQGRVGAQVLAVGPRRPDAGRHPQAAALEPERLLEPVDQRTGRRLGVDVADEQDRELVTAEPAEHRAVGHRRAGAARRPGAAARHRRRGRAGR